MKVFAKNIVLAATVLTNNVIAEEVANPFKDEKETFEKDNAETRGLRASGRSIFQNRKPRLQHRAAQLQQLPRFIKNKIFFSIGAEALSKLGVFSQDGRRMLRGRKLQDDSSVMAGCAGESTSAGCDMTCIKTPTNLAGCNEYKAGIDNEIATYSYASTAEDDFDEGTGTCIVVFHIPSTGLTADEEYARAGLEEMDRCPYKRNLQEREAIFQRRALSGSDHHASALVQATDAALTLHYYGQEIRRQLGVYVENDNVEGVHNRVTFAIEMDHYSHDGYCAMRVDVVWPDSNCEQAAEDNGCTGVPGGGVCTVTCTTSDQSTIDTLQGWGVCMYARV